MSPWTVSSIRVVHESSSSPLSIPTNPEPVRPGAIVSATFFPSSYTPGGEVEPGASLSVKFWCFREREREREIRCKVHDETLRISTEGLDNIKHGEVKGEGVLLWRTGAARPGCCHCVHCGVRGAQVSRWHFLTRCCGRRLCDMFKDCTVSDTFYFCYDSTNSKVLFISTLLTRAH